MENLQEKIATLEAEVWRLAGEEEEEVGMFKKGKSCTVNWIWN